MGASVILKSVDFKAFAVNVKTIAPKKYLYQFGHAIWCGRVLMLPLFISCVQYRHISIGEGGMGDADTTNTT